MTRARARLCFALPTLVVSLALGCGKAKYEGSTYSEALEVYNTERRELERLQNERVSIEEKFEAARAKLRAVDAERRRVRDEDYQRLMEIDPDQAAEYLEGRESRDAELAREVREGIDKLAAKHAEDMQQLQEHIASQQEQVQRARALLDKVEAPQLDNLNADAASILRQLPGGVEVDIMRPDALARHRIVHLKNWHFVPKGLFAADIRGPGRRARLPSGSRSSLRGVPVGRGSRPG